MENMQELTKYVLNLENSIRNLEKDNAIKRGLIRKLNQQYAFEIDPIPVSLVALSTATTATASSTTPSNQPSVSLPVNSAFASLSTSTTTTNILKTSPSSSVGAFINSSTSKVANQWFERGMTWTFSFNHSEAIYCFNMALTADPKMVMAMWGIAYASGPNRNVKDMTSESNALALKYARRAVDLIAVSDDCKPLEIALVTAIKSRYSENSLTSSQRELHDVLFMSSMKEIHKKYGKDHPFVTAIYADSILLLNPWDIWANRDDSSTIEYAKEAQQVLEESLKPYPEHPGLLASYIYLMETSSNPEKAKVAADTLSKTAPPDCAHLLHLPSRIYVHLGDYSSSLNCNRRAVDADVRYQELSETPAPLYTIYRVHHIHCLIYDACNLNQFGLAMEHARDISKIVDKSALEGPLVDLLDGYFCLSWHVLVYFGKWNEIIDEPINNDLHPSLKVGLAISNFSRSIAFACVGKLDEAKRERDLFVEAAKDVPDTRTSIQNPIHSIISIAEDVLESTLIIANDLSQNQNDQPNEEALQRMSRAQKTFEDLSYEMPHIW